MSRNVRSLINRFIFNFWTSRHHEGDVTAIRAEFVDTQTFVGLNVATTPSQRGTAAMAVVLSGLCLYEFARRKLFCDVLLC